MSVCEEVIRHVMMKLSPAILRPDGHRAGPLIWKPTEETLTYQEKKKINHEDKAKEKRNQRTPSFR